MERRCTACIHPSYTCDTCPITLNYWTSLPSGFILSTSGITEDRIREIIKEELANGKQLKNCGIVGTIKIEADVDSFKEAAGCVDNPYYNLSFEEVLPALKAGMRATRTDWNGKNRYVCMLEGGWELDALIVRDPFLVLFNSSGEYVPWVPSMGDLFSNKWEIIKNTTY